jgi:hypothetical protein
MAYSLQFVQQSGWKINYFISFILAGLLCCYWTVMFVSTEAKFLEVIGTKVFRLAIQSPLQMNFTPPSLLEQKWFETGLWCKHCMSKLQV